MPFFWPFARSPSIPGLHSSQLRSSLPPNSLSRFLEPLSARPSRTLQARQLLTFGAGAFVTAIFGSALLLVAGEGGSSVVLDAAGVLAAVALMAVVAALAVRRAKQDAPTAGQTSRALVTTLEDGTD